MDTSFNRKTITKKSFVSSKILKQVFFVGSMLCIVFLLTYPENHFGLPYPFTKGRNYCNKYKNTKMTENFTIKTEACTIPSLNTFDESIKKYIEYPKDLPRCLNSSQVILDHNKTHIWIRKELLEIKEIARVVSCCYRPFYRPVSIDDITENVDNRVKYSKCTIFTNIIQVKDEFVKVNCSIGIIKVEEYFLFALKKDFKPHDSHKEISKNTDSYNILILGIDSVSRLNFYRTMPKTANYLREQDFIDLNGYNKVGDNTFPNLMPILLGVSDEDIKKTCVPYSEAKFDNCPFIWEWYKQAGYYTAFAEDSSWLGTFNYLRAGFSNTPTDYYPHTFINEAESYAFQPNGFNTSKLCLNKKYFYQILLDYIEDITVTLKNKRLFGFFWEITMSHDMLNYPMVMDDDYFKLLKKLDTSSYLSDTFVFLLSDHGMRWGDIRYTKQGRLEERLPFVFLLIPQSFREKYSMAFNNLKLNSHRLTTPYDLHATLTDLVNVKDLQNDLIQTRSKQISNKNKSLSLFLPIPTNRTCELAGISDHWCTCHRRVTISKNNSKVLSAAEHLIEYLNNLLIAFKECVKLSLAEIIEASEMLAGEAEDKEIGGWHEFMIVIKTFPGGGAFEATLREVEYGWSVVGSISRLNLYGDQSHCINDNKLKLYCYCRISSSNTTRS